MNTKVLAALRAIGVVVLVAVVHWASNGTNLAPFFSEGLTGLVAALAAVLEASIHQKYGRGLLGAVKA